MLVNQNFSSWQITSLLNPDIIISDSQLSENVIKITRPIIITNTPEKFCIKFEIEFNNNVKLQPFYFDVTKTKGHYHTIDTKNVQYDSVNQNASIPTHFGDDGFFTDQMTLKEFFKRFVSEMDKELSWVIENPKKYFSRISNQEYLDFFYAHNDRFKKILSKLEDQIIEIAKITETEARNEKLLELRNIEKLKTLQPFYKSYSRKYKTFDSIVDTYLECELKKFQKK